MTYQAIDAGWHDFYIVAGTASATLVGLLFVGLSLHLRAVLSRSEVRSLARVTLANFGALLFISLFLVIPEGASAASAQLLASGAISLAISAPSLVTARRSGTRTLRLTQLITRFGLSTLAYGGIIAAGALVGGSSYEPAFNLLVVVTVVLLVVSLRNVWDLLVSVGEATLADGTG